MSLHKLSHAFSRMARSSRSSPSPLSIAPPWTREATNWAVPPPSVPTLSVAGEPDVKFPVRRVYCLCINFPEARRISPLLFPGVIFLQHQKDSKFGSKPLQGPPFFFGKPSDAIVDCSKQPAVIPYPTGTSLLHFEIEQVVALKEGGVNIPTRDALKKVFGYGVGVDLTRRDLQNTALESKRPWDMAKGFDRSGPVSALVRADKVKVDDEGRMDADLWLKLNGAQRQKGNTESYVWTIPETIHHLSSMVELKPGDLIFMGTPHGWGPLVPGDEVEGGLQGADGGLSVTVKFRMEAKK